MKCNYDTWMVNTIKQEQEDWEADQDPELDMEGCSYTSTPVLLNRMMEDNLLVTSTITFGLNRDYLKFFNYSALQNVFFNYNSLPGNSFLSDPVPTG